MEEAQENRDSRLIITFDWHEFACGCGAAFVNLGLTYPIYKLIFRQILHGVGISSAFGQLRSEGITYLYRGVFPPLAQKTLSLSLMFGVYDGTRRMLVDGLHMNNYLGKIISGLTAGTIEGALLPFERVQTLLADAKYHHHFRNTPTAFGYVLRNHGFLELYRGIVPVLIRNGPSNAAFFLLREEANDRIPDDATIVSRTTQEFIAGACIGASLSTIFYPLNVIKVSMQSEMGHERQKMWTVCKRIYYERGGRISYFFRGCGFNAFRSFMSWGVMNTAYEEIKELIT